MYKMNYEKPFLAEVGRMYVGKFSDIYGAIHENGPKILEELSQEEAKFSRTIKRGLKEFEKIVSGKNQGEELSGREAFTLFDTYGFPLEMTVELAKEKDFRVNADEFQEALKRHQELSRTAAAGKFK